ncbi:MotB family protein [Aestuariibacter sp. AA17]|uniref:MotB family protein n=1 Tax=Fluctibacter corallii TaxID=2984329 RepID=A0ABT3ABP0_9ALTE|nr:MotB family protein [Aestuariibacter sp. AA17]MCV2886091.1 MotB family protein [Aestuariibacter sp. AA17]
MAAGARDGYSSEELLSETEKSEGEQSWLATFADLMSLLMCFFVLLLSFSELDVIKFKQIAGSMKMAFGVQRDVIQEDIPKGTSVVFDQFSPSVNEPTLLEQVMQVTQEQRPDLAQSAPNFPTPTKTPTTDSSAANKNTETEIDKHTSRLKYALADHLQAGRFSIDQRGQQLIIRISEQGTFASGSGFLQPAFKPILRDIAEVLMTIPGKIIVSGHTDSIPVNNELFEDNLALSSARAVAVARTLSANADLPFIQANGLASSEPLASNRSSAGRALNRRVEIAITQGKPEQTHISLLEEGL